MGTEKFFEPVSSVVGEAFFVTDFKQWIGSCVLHDCFVAVGYAAYEEGGIFICKAAAWGNVSVGVNV